MSLRDRPENILARAMDGHDFVLFRTDSDGRVLIKQPGGVVPHFKFDNGRAKKIGDVAVSHALLGNSEGGELIGIGGGGVTDEIVPPKPIAEPVVIGDIATDSWLWRQVAVFPMISALGLRALEAIILFMTSDWVWRQYYAYVSSPANGGMSYLYHILTFLAFFFPYLGSMLMSMVYFNKAVDALMSLAGHGSRKNKSVGDEVENVLTDVIVDPNMNFAMRYSQSMICFSVKASKYAFLIIPFLGITSMIGLLYMCLYLKPLPMQEMYSYAYNIWTSVSSPTATNPMYGAFRPGGVGVGAPNQFYGGGAIPPQAPPMGSMNIPPFRR